MELDKEEKINIINQHKRNISFSKYNAEVSLIAENAVDSPNQSVIDDFNNQIANFNKKLAALDKEISDL